MHTDTRSHEQEQHGGEEQDGSGANGHDTTDWGAIHKALLARARTLQSGEGGAVDALINDTVASSIPSYVFKSIAGAIAKACGGLDATKLKKQMEAGREAREHPIEETVETPEERVARRAEAYAKCKHLAEDRDLMFHFIKDVQTYGIDREERAIVSTHLTHVSRLLDRPASLLRKGAPSSGKSAVVGAVLHFSNEGDDWIGLTAGSARSLVYKEGGVEHKTIYFMEAAGIATRSNGDEDPVAYMTRSLLSENCIKYQTVEEEKDPVTGRSRKVGRDIVLKGPTNAIITTARENVEEELATRLLLSYADESEERTRGVIRRVFSPPAKPSDDRIEQWRAFQTWLRLGPNKVIIPFGGALADMIATGQLRMRRDAASVRALIEASALLHQAQRGRDGDAIVATLDDYAWAEFATSSGLDALAAGSEVDTAAVATAISRLLRAQRKQFVQREAARGLATLLYARSMSDPATKLERILRSISVPATKLTPTQGALARLSASSTAAYCEIKAIAIKEGLAISMKDRRDVLAMALLKAPTTVRIGGRKLAQAIGVTYKIARLRLQRAIEDGVVVDETPSHETRNHPSGRLLRPADSVRARSARLHRAIPTSHALRSAWEQRL